MFDQMKQLMEMKKQAERIKRELEASSIEVDEVNGIRIVINGAQNFKSIEIDNALLGEDKKNALEGSVLLAINTAVKKSQEFAARKMRETTGFNIPGF